MRVSRINPLAQMITSMLNTIFDICCVNPSSSSVKFGHQSLWSHKVQSFTAGVHVGQQENFMFMPWLVYVPNRETVPRSPNLNFVRLATSIN